MTKFGQLVEKHAQETVDIMMELDENRRKRDFYLELAQNYFLTIYAVRVMQGEAAKHLADSSLYPEDDE